ncbi:TPA: phosphoenolpyruvate--protein phosphotransferase [bacterium]|nr:phosphoenolpyruvate--protein phosphotransferase [bacterium]
MSKRFKGIPVSPGVVIGKVYLFETYKPRIRRQTDRTRRIEEEVKLFESAVRETHQEIEKDIEENKKNAYKECADIFETHLLILNDPDYLTTKVIDKIRRRRMTAEYALREVLEGLTSKFIPVKTAHLREKETDIRDVGQRIFENLLNSKRASLMGFEEDVVVVAHSLAPSDTAQMCKERVIGFVTDVGSRTSHSAIMARALEIPAVVGLGDISAHIKRGDTIIIDGLHGEVIVNPTKEEIASYEKKRQEYFSFMASFDSLRDLPARTQDGYQVKIMANIEIQEEIRHARSHGAEGIGLYRTEFLFLNRLNLPSEKEQFEVYREVAQIYAPYPVVIRTLDIGGDKFVLSLLENPDEPNPFLGLRAIRLSLEHVDIFKKQLSAILRAGVYGNLKVMLPMITDIGEVIRAKEILQEVADDLRKRGISFDEDMEIGAMIETPSAALTADLLAKEVNFFSIGTNDLIQYALAIDRSNERVAHLYKPFHPAILRLIHSTIIAAHRWGRRVAMCGEMAANPLFTAVLIGLGLDEFSMSGVVIPGIKEVIRSISLVEAKDLADKALKLERADQVESLVKERLGKRLENIFGAIEEA